MCLCLLGCKNSQVMLPGYNGGLPQTVHFDSMPTEGWATDPNFSYQMFSYYPYNFKLGGFGPHGPENFKRIGI